MTRKTFILTGLFLIALAPLCTASHAFLMLSKITPAEMTAYLQLFLQVAILLAFCLLVWKRLNFISKSHQFKVWFFAGFLATFFISLTILPPFLFTSIGINPVDALNDEIANWVNSGGKGDFSFSTYGKIKVAIFSAILSVVINWPFFAALYFCARDPRSPKGDNPFSHLPIHADEENSAVLSLKKPILP